MAWFTDLFKGKDDEGGCIYCGERECPGIQSCRPAAPGWPEGGERIRKSERRPLF